MLVVLEPEGAVQLSERFRRGVVVPLDDEADKIMEAGEVNEDSRVHFVGITRDGEFESLWETSLFATVNEATGCMVDDYEDEVIPAEMVSRVRTIAESYVKKGAGWKVELPFFMAFKEACEIAERERRPIYFVL